MTTKLTRKDYEILHTLIQSHLNQVGELMADIGAEGQKDDYLWRMEKIEHKLYKFLVDKNKPISK